MEASEQLILGLICVCLKIVCLFLSIILIKTKGLLVSTVPPYETGVSSVVVNGGNVSNKGMEFEFDGVKELMTFLIVLQLIFPL